MIHNQNDFAIHLSQGPDAWRWCVVDVDGSEAAAGESEQQDVAMRMASVVMGSLSRFRAVTGAW